MVDYVARDRQTAGYAAWYADGLICVYQRFGCIPPDDSLAREFFAIANDQNCMEEERLILMTHLLENYRQAIVFRANLIGTNAHEDKVQSLR